VNESGDSEHDRGTSQSTVSCRHDDVGGKVWRAVTTLSPSARGWIYMIGRAIDPISKSRRVDCESSPFFVSLIVAELLRTRGDRWPMRAACDDKPANIERDRTEPLYFLYFIWFCPDTVSSLSSSSHSPWCSYDSAWCRSVAP
jgi:hypothetical protein